MNPLLLGPIFEIGKTLLDRFVPDPEKKAAAEMDLIRMAADGELKQVIAQLEINAKEAAHPSVFVSGGRPFIMWICGVGLAYSCIGHPLLSWFSAVKGWPLPPTVDSEVLMYVLGGLLGLGGMRTFEKTKGVASK